MPLDLAGLDFPAFERAARAALPSGAGLAAAVYGRALRTGRLEPEALGASAANAARWREAFSLGLLAEAGRLEELGELGVTAKLLLRLEDGAEVECVAVPMRRTGGGLRHSLCVSSQAGCARACAFCETGRAGLVRNLTAAEIVGQLLAARALLGLGFDNVVFMGMGEPLDNLEGLEGALRVLAEPRGLGYAWERLTVCTSAPEGAIPRLRALGLRRLNLSVSLNAARDELRDVIMPANRRGGLARLEAELAAYPMRRNFVLGVNYCLIPGLNDGPADAAALAAFVARVGRAFVNLIPYNPGRAPLGPAPGPEELAAFSRLLDEAGLRWTRRETRGASIMAACGQLGGPAG